MRAVLTNRIGHYYYRSESVDRSRRDGFGTVPAAHRLRHSASCACLGTPLGANAPRPPTEQNLKTDPGQSRLKGKLIMISRTASLLMLFLAATALAQEKTDREERTVAVSARSEVVVPPDQVLIDFTVATKKKDLTEARNANDTITQSVFQIVHQLEIPAEDFQVTDLAVSPDTNQWGVLVGYTVNRVVLCAHPEIRGD